MTPAERLYNEINKLKDEFVREKDPKRLWTIRRKLRNLNQIYNVCVTKEMHDEVIKNEMTTRGY